jgi:hypothetical protein
MSKNEKLEVTIKYNEIKQTISGSPDIVTREYFNFLSKVIPAFDVALDLVARPSISEMAARLKGSVHLYGQRVIILKKVLNTEDAVLLALVSKYVGFGLKATLGDSMSLEEIIEATEKPKKSVTIVLDKLGSTGAIEQIDQDKFRISDWKAYEYILKRLPDTKTAKITDFGTEKEKPVLPPKGVAFTIGYEGRDPNQFLKALEDGKIEVLVDVRKDAYSNRDKSFSEGSLSRILANAKIKYIHVPELGVDYAQRQELKSNHDYEGYFKQYSDYLEKNPDLVSFLNDLSKSNTVCIMCYEKDFRRCHRMVLADKLEKEGMVFHHL